MGYSNQNFEFGASGMAHGIFFFAGIKWYTTQHVKTAYHGLRISGAHMECLLWWQLIRHFSPISPVLARYTFGVCFHVLIMCNVVNRKQKLTLLQSRKWPNWWEIYKHLCIFAWLVHEVIHDMQIHMYALTLSVPWSPYGTTIYLVLKFWHRTGSL